MEGGPKNNWGGETGGARRTNADIIDRINELNDEIGKRHEISENHKNVPGNNLVNKRVRQDQQEMIEQLTRERDQLKQELQQNVFNILMENNVVFRNKISDYDERIYALNEATRDAPNRANVVAYDKYRKNKAERDALKQERKDYVRESEDAAIAQFAGVEYETAEPAESESEPDVDAEAEPVDVDAVDTEAEAEPVADAEMDEAGETGEVADDEIGEDEVEEEAEDEADRTNDEDRVAGMKDGSGWMKQKAKKGVEPLNVIDLNDDEQYDKLMNEGEDEGESDETEKSSERAEDVKEFIDHVLGKNALVMAIDTSESRDKMAKRLASEKVKEMKSKGLIKGVMGKQSEGAVYRDLLKTYKDKIDATGDIYGEESGSGNEQLLKEYENYAQEMIDEQLSEYETLDGGHLEKKEEGANALKYVLMELANNVANGMSREDALKVFYGEAVKKAGETNEIDEESKELGGIAKLQEAGLLPDGLLGADNLQEMADKIIRLAKESKRVYNRDESDVPDTVEAQMELRNELFGPINEYLENHVSLYTGEAEVGIEAKTKLSKTAAIVAATGGGALSAAGIWGVGYGIRKAVSYIPVIGQVAGLAGGIVAGIDQARTNLNQYDVDTALGRKENIERRRNNKSILNRIFNTNVERGAYNFDVNKVDEYLDAGVAKELAETSDANKLSGMFDKYLTENDGRFELKEGLNETEINELSTLVAMTRARFEVGHERGRDLITYDVENGGDLTQIQEQRGNLTQRAASAMRLLRVNGYGDDVANREDRAVKMMGKELGVMKTAGNFIKHGGVLAVVKRAAIGAIIGTAFRQVSAYAMDKLQVQDRLNALLDRDTNIEGQPLPDDGSDTTGSGYTVGESTGDYRDSLRAYGEMNGSMENDNVILSAEVDSNGNVIEGSYKVLDDIANDENTPANGLFEDTGVTVQFEKDGTTLTAESIEKIKELYGCDTVEKIESGISFPTETTAGSGNIINDESLLNGYTRLDGSVTSMNASDVRDGGDNWIINVWNRGQGAEVNENTRYFFQVGGSRENMFAYKVGENGEVSIPKDSIVGKELIQDVDGDGKLDILGSSHGVMEINPETGEAVTQASLPGENSVTFESLQETYGTPAETSPQTADEAISYVFKADGKPDITIRSPKQVYSDWAGREGDFIDTHYHDGVESYSRTMLMEQSVDLGGGNEYHAVMHAGGHNVAEDVAYLDADKVKPYYEAAPLVDGIYDENGNVTVDFDSMSEAERDRIAAEAVQRMAESASMNARKAELLSEAMGTDNGAEANLTEINALGRQLEMDDVEFDKHNNSILQSIYEKIEEGGYKAKLVKIESGTYKSSTYLAEAASGEKNLVGSPNMVTDREEWIVVLENDEGENFFDSEAVREITGAASGTEYSQVGIHLLCDQITGIKEGVPVNASESVTENTMTLVPNSDGSVTYGSAETLTQ